MYHIFRRHQSLLSCKEATLNGMLYYVSNVKSTVILTCDMCNILCVWMYVGLTIFFLNSLDIYLKNRPSCERNVYNSIKNEIYIF